MTSKYPLIPDHQKVRIFWGGFQSVFEIGSAPMEKVMGVATEWFAANDHYFHLDKFPPFIRKWGNEKMVTIDYGSYVHFLYCIPDK